MLHLDLVLETDITLRFNTYKEVHGDREIYRLRNFISSGLQQMKKIVFQHDGKWNQTQNFSTAYLEVNDVIKKIVDWILSRYCCQMVEIICFRKCCIFSQFPPSKSADNWRPPVHKFFGSYLLWCYFHFKKSALRSGKLWVFRVTMFPLNFRIHLRDRVPYLLLGTV